MAYKTVLNVSAAVLFGMAGSMNVSVAGDEVYVAGTKPYERPASAPVIKMVEKPKGWYTKALTGVIPPYPYSLHFLEAQGNWYTPFTRPGMHGRYDIRGWHHP
jgi:hypothetical protein